MHWMAAKQNSGSVRPGLVWRGVTRGLIAALMVSGVVGPTGACPAQEERSSDSSFDWADYQTSAADLRFDGSAALLTQNAGLDADQWVAWQNLLDDVRQRRQVLRDEYPDDWVSRWESAFYRYVDARRTAWQKGSLLIHRQQKKDPFRRSGEDSSPQTQEIQEYSVLADILDHPEDFIGKPIVLRGILKRPVPVAVSRSETLIGAEGMTLPLGELRPLDGEAAPMAIVHTSSLHRTSGSDPGTGPWPRVASELPVLIKGWVVKLWGDQRPLIHCETVRELSLQPPATLIQQTAVARQPIRQEEAWLYYETLASLAALDQLRADKPQTWQALFPVAGLSSGDTPERAAARFLNRRLEDLLREIAEKVQTDTAALEQQRETQKIAADTYDREIERLTWLVDERRQRFSEAQKDHRRFDTYVDVFMNPDVWQGQPATLRGHVRHVVSYPAGHPEFAGGRLHELWLYTDDSQNNPAVIVTSQLPAEFPVDAPLIDQVSVTGVVFKQYVYRSQKSRRIAPLILAGSVQWTPTDSHLLALQEEGHLSSGSVLAQRVRNNRAEQPGAMGLMLVIFISTVVLMVLWGRAQRDRRDRRNLMNRIAHAPEFESSLDGEYAPRLSDYTSGYDI